MRDLFNIDNPFFRLMGRLADLIILNLIFIAFSIPIFTIGASTTAMYYVTLKMTENEEGYVFRSFWKSFKQNFRQATIIWLLMLAAGIILSFDMYILNYSRTAFNTVFIVIISSISILYLIELIFIFPLLSRFDNSIKTTFRNSFIMAIADFPRVLVMMALVVGSALLTMWNHFTFWYGLLIWMLCGFALIAFANSFLFNKIFKKYIPDEAQGDADENTFPTISKGNAAESSSENKTTK